MARTYTLPFLILIACDQEVAIDTDVPVTSPTETVDTDYAPECAMKGKSSCNNSSSIVQGAVRLKPGLTDETRGNLLITLVHEAIGGGSGGVYHIHTLIEDADLREPVPFRLDMCDNGAMWSEDNGEYSLQVVLDLNGSNGGKDAVPISVLPEPGEPSRRMRNLWMSCSQEPLCLDVELRCMDGSPCGTFTDDDCNADDASCGSDVSLCTFY